METDKPIIRIIDCEYFAETKQEIELFKVITRLITIFVE